MDYIKRGNNGVVLKTESGIEIINGGIKKYLNDLCLNNLATFDGRKKAIGKLLKEKKNLPIYINYQLFVYPTKALREYDVIFINYHHVLSYKEITPTHTKIIFNNLDELIIDISFKRVEKQHQRIAYILEYLGEHS